MKKFMLTAILSTIPLIQLVADATIDTMEVPFAEDFNVFFRPLGMKDDMHIPKGKQTNIKAGKYYIRLTNGWNPMRGGLVICRNTLNTIENNKTYKIALKKGGECSITPNPQ